MPTLRLLFLLVLSLTTLPTVPLSAAEPKRLTILDYFLTLPDQTLEAPAPEILRFIQRSKETVIDTANGYMSARGDGAQSDFTVALFRYKADDRPLLAVCQGEPGDLDFIFLQFFELGANGRMQKARRSVFPVPDGKDRRFELPRHGRTILVRSDKTGKVQRRFAWDGAGFVEEK